VLLLVLSVRLTSSRGGAKRAATQAAPRATATSGASSSRRPWGRRPCPSPESQS